MRDLREKATEVVRVGMTWGGIGGIVGFLASLLGPLAGMVASGFMGVSCGRRCARASGESAASGGALAGLVGGLVAAPVFVIGAAAGAVVAVRRIGAETVARTLEEMLGTTVSPEEAWRLYLLSLALVAALEIAILLLAAAIAGALATRTGNEQGR